MTNFKTLLLFCLLLGATLAGNAQTIRYVKMDGTGSGSSWTNASDDLQAMINLSQAGDEIWVAEGVYVPRYTADGYDSENGIYPDYNGDMNDAFVLKSGLKIYGGFVPAELGSGTITAPAFGAAGRNGITILDGDNRCFHVVISAGLEANTLLDGLTISGGNGTRLFSMEITVNGEVIDPTFGSGIYIENSSPTLTNVTISRNFSIERGGGIYINNSSSPRLVNVTISSNRSDRDSGSGSGGGMYIGDNSSPTLVNVTISGNNAYSGGGIFIDSSSPTLVNVTISSNRSAIGGGMYNYSSSTEINNSIIWGNKAGAGENNIYYQGSNIPVFNHSLVEGLTGPGIILNTNPLFENWIDPESAPNTLGDYRLKAGSPAIDVGNNSLYLTARGIADFNGETDLAGNPRLAGGTIDLGAYEYPAPPLQGTISITGTTTYGEMLTANTSGITSAAPLGALSYKWKRSGSDISGANGNTYTLVAGDIGNAITLEVSAAYYSGSLTSTPTAAVGKKGITFTGTVSATKVYDGNANFTNAQITVNSAGSFSDLVGSDVVTLNKTGVTGTYGPNAGTGTLARSGNFSIIGANAGNYTLLAQPIVTATITPASRAVQWGNRSFTYTGSAQAPTASITGVGSVGVITLAVSGSQTNAGTGYSATASFSPANANYTLTGATTTFSIAKSNTATTLSSNLNPSVYGQSVTFTATVAAVSPGGGTPYGSVEFREGGTVLGTVALNASGTATYTTSTLSIGMHLVTAYYLGNSNYNASNSSAVNQIVESSIVHTNGIVYVDCTKSGDGSSWTDAYPNLADPLLIAAQQYSGAIAVASTDTIRAIYVAEGTYYPMYTADGYDFTGQNFPETDGDRDNAFVLVPGLKIYGGFVPGDIPAGIDIPAFGATGRNGITTLNGDLLNDDLPGDFTTNKSDNCFHILIGVYIPNNGETLIDGFTLSGSYADDSGGSGNITVNSITINRNYGGMFNYQSSPTLLNMTVKENFADWSGGGIYNDASSPTLTNVTISGNIATNAYGGGMYNHNYSSPTLVNVTISGNNASYGGGMFNDNYSSPALTNVTISGNLANGGGGMYNDNSSSPQIQNGIIWGNTAVSGDNVSNNNSSVPVYNYSLVGGASGAGIILNTNPLFENWIDPYSAPMPNTLGDYRLKSGSPAIDAGNNNLYLTACGVADFTGETDLAGKRRLTGSTIDLGAYEHLSFIWQGGANSDWHAAGNWQDTEVPTETDMVTIKGNALHFPVLGNSTSVAEIHFEPGAQMGNQSYLQAGKTFVQYDLSKRERWNMLSIPLGQAYPADFAFGGYPVTWVRTFSYSTEGGLTKGVWTTAKNNSRGAFSFGDGFVIWLSKDGGANDNANKGLKLLRDTLELPFFENGNKNVNQAHDFVSEVTEPKMIGTSTFHNYKLEGTEYVVVNEEYYTVTRSESAYQLAGSGAVEQVADFENGDFALIGNPYMAALDFLAFYNENASRIKPSYQIWIYDSGGKGGYLTFSPEGIAGVIGEDNSDGQLIAPLQGFIVEKEASVSESASLVFKEGSMAKANTSVSLRSASAGNKLDIVARNPAAGVRTFIADREGGQNEFGKLDARKIINEISDVPEVYTLKPYKNGSVATAINIINNNDDLFIPLCLATTYSGDFTFTLSGMDSYDANLSLIDFAANRTINLTGLSSYDYAFKYAPAKKANGETAVCEDRFFIRISKSVTGLTEIEAGKVNVFESNGFIQIISGASNPIKEVTVYDLQGTPIYKANAVNQISHTVERELLAGAYIVRVVSEKNAENVKVIKK